MLYAQFFHRAVWPAGTTKIIESCGDRAVIILDGRERSTTHHAISRKECMKRGYLGYRLYRGETFTRSLPITEYVSCTS
jgi:hypothetical protein